MEKNGIMLPVVILNIIYSKPAFYDDILVIKTSLVKPPKVSIEFDYEIYNNEKELITTAYSKLVFMDSKTRLVSRCPQTFLDKLQYISIFGIIFFLFSIVIQIIIMRLGIF